MAYEGFQLIAPGITAGADLSTIQYHFVYLSTNNTVASAASTAVLPFGVLQNNPLSGQAAQVCIMGITKVKLGATSTFGTLITQESSGLGAQFDPALGSSNNTMYALGHIIQGGAASGYATAFINCATPQYYRATA